MIRAESAHFQCGPRSLGDDLRFDRNAFTLVASPAAFAARLLAGKATSPDERREPDRKFLLRDARCPAPADIVQSPVLIVEPHQKILDRRRAPLAVNAADDAIDECSRRARGRSP